MHTTQDEDVPAHAVTTPAPEKYPAEQVHTAAGCAAPPAQEFPAGHTAQVPALPAQPPDVAKVDERPAAHVQATCTPALPAHDSPAPQVVQGGPAPAQDVTGAAGEK